MFTSLHPVVEAAPSSEKYGDYSMMFKPVAGHYYSGSWYNRWAWEPQGGDVSFIRWGDPKPWPVDYYEKFELSDDKQWVLLDGYGNSERFQKQRVEQEWIGEVVNGKCTNLKPLPKVEGGKQHYAKWNIPSTSYCLKAKGKIGDLVKFEHQQIWSAPAACSNKFIKGRKCIKQYEIWKDNNNNGKIEDHLTVRHDRYHYFAKGLGPAFIIKSKDWRADMKEVWNYKTNKDLLK